LIFHRRVAEDAEMNLKELTESVIACAMEVHRSLGPGLLESAYEHCLCHEMKIRGLPFERQVALPVKYKGVSLDCGYRIDILVDKRLILEIKTVDAILKIHVAQLLTYLKMLDLRVGLLLNFNVDLLKNGIKRVVNNYEDES